MDLQYIAKSFAAANVASLTLTASTITGTQGQVFNNTVATFTDAISGIVASAYSAAIDWGDGNTSTGAVVSNGSGGFNVVGSNVFAETGALVDDITITELGGATTEVTGTVNVVGLTVNGNTVSANQSASYAGPVATFTDTAYAGNTNYYTASINWENGTITTGTISNSSGTFTVSGTNTYTSAGTFDPTILITAGDGRTTSTEGEA